MDHSEERLVLLRRRDAGALNEGGVRIALAADEGAHTRLADAAEGADEIAILIHATTDRTRRAAATVIAVAGVLGDFTDLLILLEVALAITLAEPPVGKNWPRVTGAPLPLFRRLASASSTVAPPTRATAPANRPRTAVRRVDVLPKVRAIPSNVVESIVVTFSSRHYAAGSVRQACPLVRAAAWASSRRAARFARKLCRWPPAI